MHMVSFCQSNPRPRLWELYLRQCLAYYATLMQLSCLNKPIMAWSVCYQCGGKLFNINLVDSDQWPEIGARCYLKEELMQRPKGNGKIMQRLGSSQDRFVFVIKAND